MLAAMERGESWAPFWSIASARPARRGCCAWSRILSRSEYYRAQKVTEHESRQVIVKADDMQELNINRC